MQGRSDIASVRLELDKDKCFLQDVQSFPLLLLDDSILVPSGQLGLDNNYLLEKMTAL